MNALGSKSRLLGSTIGTILCLCTALYLPFPVAAEDSDLGNLRMYYIVRKGDCLWSISDRYYGDPYVWPYVWGKNPYISNPHWIFPGEPVYLASVREETMRLMEPAARTTAVPEGFAIPEPVDTPRDRARVGLRVSPGLVDVSILTREEIRKAGKVVASEDGRSMMATGDTIYLHCGGDALKEKAPSYQILKEIREIRHPVTGENMGTVYGIMGYAEVAKWESHGVARARLQGAREPITVGDLVRKGTAPEDAIYSRVPSRNLSGYLLGSASGVTEISQYDACFIDRGVLHGVQTGDTFLVYARGRSVEGSEVGSVVALPDVRVGVIVVVHTEMTSSTGLVTESRGSLVPGYAVRAWVE